MKNANRTDRRAARMAFWWKAKVAHGKRGWKAAKKRIKRIRRDTRRVQNALIDNAMLTT